MNIIESSVKKKHVKFFPIHAGPVWRAEQISRFRSPQPDKLMPQDHGYGASASRRVPVYAPTFAGTKLYCFVTETHRCEQSVAGFYPTARRQGLEPTIFCQKFYAFATRVTYGKLYFTTKW